MNLVRFDPISAGPAEWARVHAFRRARHAESDPDGPLLSDEEIEADAREPDPHYTQLRWLALEGEQAVGSLSTFLLTRDSPDFAERKRFLHVFGAVLQPWRRHGIARRLFAEVNQVMLAHGKTTLTMGTHEDDGHGFLRHIGAVEKLRWIENHVHVDDLDRLMLTRWEQAALAAGRNLTLEAYRGRVPFEVLEPLLPTIAAMMNDMPWGALDRPPTRLDIGDTREWYSQLDRSGGAHHLVLLREPDGSVTGVAEASWDARIPHRSRHIFTGVRRDRRGRGIAKGLKAAILRQVLSSHPEVATIVTSNGQQNAAILSVNARLGFRPHRTYATYQIDRDGLASWLARAR